MSDGMRRELVYLSSHATNRYFIPNWGIAYDVFFVSRHGFRSQIYAFYTSLPSFLGNYTKYLKVFKQRKITNTIFFNLR